MDEKTRSADSETVVGAYEAKTRFSELIARAEKGERFLVTKNGRPVARIAPAEAANQERARSAAEAIRKLAASIDLSDVTWDEIKVWRDEGRP